MLKTVFRYPGGKTKLVNNILTEIGGILSESYSSQLFEERDTYFTFVDVFIGGGSVSLGVANEYPTANFVLNDLDEWMFNFWEKICINDIKHLTTNIMNHNPPSVQDFEHWRKIIDSGKSLTSSEKAFLALFFNRTAFSGIFKSGPMGGFSQKGKYKIDCRYNAKKMVEMVKQISKEFENRKVECLSMDFAKVVKKYGKKEDAFLYLDPPYMKQGHQLYNHYMQKHEYQEMADLLKGCKAKWLLSHDDNPELIEMFKGWANIKTIEGVAYTINSIKGKKRTELLISA